MTGPGARIDGTRRIAAVAAIALGLGAVVVAIVAAQGEVIHLVLFPVLILVSIAAAWVAATRHGVARMVAGAVAAGAVVVAVVDLFLSDVRTVEILGVVGLIVGSTVLTRYALHRDQRSLKVAAVPGTPVGGAQHGVLIMNLKSGDGKAERFELEDRCRERGIEPVVLQPGDDLVALARDAIDRGADVIGMAGGDGSQALVASVAAERGIPLVCIPAGTRNHFALDLGLDRDDVVGALDAFGGAVERSIDLADVNGRVFVNNVSLGVYAKIVQSPGYRDAKGQTTAEMLPELLGPDADPFDLRFTGPDGSVRTGAQIIQVSNNPYVLTSLNGFGTRARLDTGNLGVAAAEVHNAAEVAAFVAAEGTGQLARFPGWTGWSCPTFTVESSGPVEAGVDGEALVLDAPLVFRARPAAVRVRIPTHAPGYSPAALKPASIWWTLLALGRAVAGEPTPLDEWTD